MNANNPIKFIFEPEASSARLFDGWGKGALHLNHEPYWYGSDSDGLFSWTWIDLLEYFAINWKFLIINQQYPYEWLNHISNPGEMWALAEERWARYGEERADNEEPALLAFEKSHNLALAWKGIFFPSLILMRSGNVMWICADGKPPIRAEFTDTIAEIIRVCDLMANHFSGSNNSRVVAAIENWKNRDAIKAQDLVEISTGLTADAILSIQNGSDASSYWEVPSNDPFFDNELLAAARMARGTVSPDSIKLITEEIKKITKLDLEELNRLSCKTKNFVVDKDPRYAFEAGYLIANFVRQHVPMVQNKFADIESLIKELNIEVKNISFQADSIDAVAIWGSRGPCIMLNSDRKHSENAARTRMTLAHELCHLIFDRHGGLPFGEVLGGAVDDFIEKRANAFAAELLLPRASVSREWENHDGSLADFLTTLVNGYGISKTVACAQIYNSDIFEGLDQKDRNLIQRRLSHERYHNSLMLKSAVNGAVI